VASSDDAIITKTLDGVVTSWNPAAERLYGWTAGEVLGLHISFLIPPDKVNELAGILSRLKSGERIGYFETVRMHRDGRRIDVSLTISPVRDAGGRLIEVSKTGRDIQQQKREERQAQQLAAIVSDAEYAIISQTLDGVVTTWNSGAVRLYGYTAEEAIGRHASFLLPPGQLDNSRIYREKIAGGESVPAIDVIRLHKNGGRLEVSVGFSPVRDLEGRVIGLSGIGTNISLRKRAERERQLLLSIIDFSPDFIGIARPDQSVEFVNRAGQAMVGLDGDEHVRRTTILDYYAEIEGERIGREVIPVLQTGGCVAGEASFRHFQTGMIIPTEWNVFAIPDPAGGDEKYFACVAQDITKRKQVEVALRAGEARLRAFVEHVSAPVAMLDRDMRYLHVSRRWLTDYHLGDRDVVGLSHYEVFPEIPQSWKEIHQRCLAGEVDICEEVRLERADGTAQWLRWEVRPWMVSHDEIGGIIMLTEDITARKSSEDALKASEARYRTLVAASAAVVWDSPASGEFDSVQPGWTVFTGQSLEQHRGWGWLEAIHPDDREKSAQAWSAAMTRRHEYQVEHRLRRADGEYREMTVRAVPILDANGDIREWVGVHNDVTEQRRAGIERAELLTQLTLQIERMPLAYMLSGPDFRFTRWNPAAERIFGFAEAEILGKHPCETIVPLQSRAMVESNFARLAAGDMDAHGTAANVTKDGRIVTCEWHNTPLFGPNNTFLGVLSLAQDVTARQQAEQALHLRDRAIQAASQGLVITDAGIPDHPIVYINLGFERMTGYAPEDVLGCNCRFLQGKDTDPALIKKLHEATQAGELCSVELLNYRKDGTTFWNELSISPVWDSAGRLTHYIGVMIDVTARRSLEEQFRQAQKMDAFGQLAGGVAHDFNNLLTIINGYSELLLQSLPPSDPSREMIAEIYNAGERSAGLTRQLLAFSRQQVLAPRILDLNAVVADTEKMLRRLIGEDILLTTTLATQLWAVRADPGQVEQVLMNLAVNARDAMPRGGRLTIETLNVTLDEAFVRTYANARAGPHVVMSVSDTGGGMPPEVQAKIFEPFFTTKGAGKGTGLGLATVFGIIKQSGGHVCVMSQVGVGTTFKVYLPQVAHVTAAKVPLGRGSMPRGTEIILLVEDEHAVRALTRQILLSCGYTVLEAADGAEGLRLATEHRGRIDLLITDVVMPGMGGRELAEQATERHPGLRVLFVSGYTDDAVIRHGVLREGVHFLQKPFSPFALAVKVRDVLFTSRTPIFPVQLS